MSRMGTRRKSRELAVQMLFQMDMGKQTADHVRKTFWAERADVDDETRGFTEDLFRYAADTEQGHHQRIDELIEKHAANWRLERMAAVDRNVLRAAVAEMLAFPNTPKPVVINEAIEIARKFSAPDAINFINGVLDSIAKDL
jgi:N utilization substance protein B